MRKASVLALIAVIVSFYFTHHNEKCEASFQKIQIDDSLHCSFICLTPDGQNAIYIKQFETGRSIIKYDIAKKTKTTLNKVSKKPSFIFEGCHYWASDDYACWLDEGRIYACNLKTNEETLVSEKAGSPRSISVASHYLFWSDCRPGEKSNACLYFKDLNSSESPKCIYESKNRNYRDFFCFAFESYDNTYYAFHDFNDDKSRIMLFDSKEKSSRLLWTRAK